MLILRSSQNLVCSQIFKGTNSFWLGGWLFLLKTFLRTAVCFTEDFGKLYIFFFNLE